MVASISTTIRSGDVLVAVPLAFAAGLVSFFSPCVLPLVPGYVAFLGGSTGAESLAAPRPHRVRVLLGALAFVGGFSIVYMSLGTVFGGFGEALRSDTRGLEIGLGSFTILLGLLFAGVLPRASLWQRELKVHWLPPATIAGAAALGVLFGLAWTPCNGPTLAAINALVTVSPGATAWRGTTLLGVYCLGLGVPFLVAALASDSMVRVSRFVRRHGRVVMAVGGLLLIAIGVLEVSGTWVRAVQWMQDHVGSPTSPL